MRVVEERIKLISELSEWNCIQFIEAKWPEAYSLRKEVSLSSSRTKVSIWSYLDLKSLDINTNRIVSEIYNLKWVKYISKDDLLNPYKEGNLKDLGFKKVHKGKVKVFTVKALLFYLLCNTNKKLSKPRKDFYHMTNTGSFKDIIPTFEEAGQDIKDLRTRSLMSRHNILSYVTEEQVENYLRREHNLPWLTFSNLNVLKKSNTEVWRVVSLPKVQGLYPWGCEIQNLLRNCYHHDRTYMHENNLCVTLTRKSGQSLRESYPRLLKEQDTDLKSRRNRACTLFLTPKGILFLLLSSVARGKVKEINEEIFKAVREGTLNELFDNTKSSREKAVDKSFNLVEF